MMGWWKPYFFMDVNGVQILFKWAKIETETSIGTFVTATIAIAILCIVDRWTHHYYTNNQKRLSSSATNNNPNLVVVIRNICFSTALWTFQRFTSGLIMLIMMSFNMILFIEVILFLGLAELVIRLWFVLVIVKKKGREEGVNNDEFQQLQQQENLDAIEMC